MSIWVEMAGRCVYGPGMLIKEGRKGKFKGELIFQTGISRPGLVLRLKNLQNKQWNK
jgi:hypothetical protein